MKNMPTNQVLYDEIKESIKKKVNRFPSAYASGMIVSEYKAKMKELGKSPYHGKAKDGGLTRWFNEKWVDIKTGKPCGMAKSTMNYPTCRPTIKVSKKTPTTINELSTKDKTNMMRQKQQAKTKTINYKETEKTAKTAKTKRVK